MYHLTISWKIFWTFLRYPVNIVFVLFSERDALERQIVDLERSCTVYKTELEGKTEQMEMIRNQVGA